MTPPFSICPSDIKRLEGDFCLSESQKNKIEYIDLVLNCGGLFILADGCGTGKSYISTSVAACRCLNCEYVVYLSLNNHLRYEAMQKFMKMKSKQTVIFETYLSFSRKFKQYGYNCRIILDDIYLIPVSGVVYNLIPVLIRNCSQVLVISHAPFRMKHISESLFERYGLCCKDIKLNTTNSQLKFRIETLSMLKFQLKGCLSCDYLSQCEHSIKVITNKVQGMDRLIYDKYLSVPKKQHDFLSWEVTLKIKKNLLTWCKDIENGYCVIIFLPPRVDLNSESLELLNSVHGCVNITQNYPENKLKISSNYNSIWVYSSKSPKRLTIYSTNPIKQYILGIDKDPNFLHYQLGRCLHYVSERVTSYLVVLETFRDRLLLSTLSDYNYTLSPRISFNTQTLSLTLLELFSRWLYLHTYPSLSTLPKTTILRDCTKLYQWISARNLDVSDDLAILFLKECCRLHPHAFKWLSAKTTKKHSYDLGAANSHPIASLPRDAINIISAFTRGRQLDVVGLVDYCGISIFDCKSFSVFFSFLQKIPLYFQDQIWSAWKVAEKLSSESCIHYPIFMLLTSSSINSVKLFRTIFYF